MVFSERLLLYRNDMFKQLDANNDGAISKQSIEKTFELREKAGKYDGKKAPPYTNYVDTTLVEDAKKQLGWK